MKTFRADLHIHTVLSPCADIEMLPPLIVQEAVRRGIQMIAITDHNGSANVESVQEAASDSDLFVFPGMEMQTREEVHVLCLFDTLEQVRAYQAWVDEGMPHIANSPDYFGVQLIVDRDGEMIGEEKQLLLVSTRHSFEQAVQKTNELGGLLIPAHVDRKGFGLIQNLGLVPQDVQIEALEITRHITPEKAYQSFAQIRGYPLVQNGDAHQLDDLLGTTCFLIEKPSICELRLALSMNSGRSFSIVR